jgi:hypothetical protein
MDELFRFVALRPAAPDPDTIVLDESTDLAGDLVAARRMPAPAAALHDAARAFASSDEFVADPASLVTPLAAVADALDSTDGESLATVLEHVFDGSSTEAVAGSPAFEADVGRLQDTLLALKLARGIDVHATVLAATLRLRRAAEVVRDVAAGRPVSAGWARRLVALPGSIFPVPDAVATTPDPPTDDGAAQDQLLLRAQAATEALRAVRDATALATGTERSSTDEIDERRFVLDRATVEDRRERVALDWSPAAHGDGGGGGASGGLPLTGDVRQTLSHLGLDADSTPPAMITRALSIELGSAVSKLDQEHGRHGIVGMYGGPWKPVTEPELHDDAADPAPAAIADPPATHGQVKPAGVADLLVVRQHVRGYAPGELAYVENVPAGEKLARTTTRTDVTEDVTVVEHETTKERQQDTQATDRFDLHRESGEVLRSDAARQPGSPSSASYGVVVETGGSKELTQKEAGTFGRDVTSRAVGRLAERTRTETMHRTVQTFTEEIHREVDNSAAATHHLSLYQWLDRVVEAQVFSYGQRTFYDIVVPEPAALLLRALARRAAPDGPLVKPAPFTLRPTEVNEVNYGYYVAGYGATGTEPPPEPTLVLAESFANVASDMHSDQRPIREITKVEKTTVTVPSGYRAVKAIVRVNAAQWDDELHTFGLTIGTHGVDLRPPQPWRQTIKLDGEVGSVPVTFATTWVLFLYTVNIEVVCEPTERHFDEWCHRTHETILQASRQRIAEYEDRSANLRAVLRMEALNVSSDRKRAIEREELQRSCLAVLTNQQFDGLSAIEHSVQGYPQPFLPNVGPLGRYVRFLQQAFEWEQMTWRYHPYFWGRKQYWLDKLLLDDPDTQFRDFLRAGASRVLVPVRPGFEGAVAHFMDTGDVPTVAALGEMVSPLYLPFVAGGATEDASIEEATPYAPSWQIRAPTTLVKLRPAGTMPAWTSGVDGGGHVVWTAGPGDPV